MVCPRCQGHMVREWMYDYWSEADRVEARRCVNCGYVEDAVIRVRRGKEVGCDKGI